MPEPIATDPDLAEHVELAESVEFAMLVVLETLSPLQRTVFVLREAFGLSYGEIAVVVGRDLQCRGRSAVRRVRVGAVRRAVLDD